MTSQPGKRIKKYPPTKLVLRDNKIFYDPLLIEKGEDKSLYVKFPRKRGYHIKDSHESVDIPSKITFQERLQGTIFYDLYLSYHAVNGKTHANAFIHQDKSDKRKKVSFFTDTASTTAKVLLREYEFAPFASAVKAAAPTASSRRFPVKRGSQSWTKPSAWAAAFVSVNARWTPCPYGGRCRKVFRWSWQH
jgi:hypothetical protein